MNAFVKDFGMLAAVYLETCVHCGMCADACHFYEVTKEAKYTPILKVEPFKQAYKREYGPFAPVYRLLNLTPKVTIGELERWQELLYEVLQRLRPLLARLSDGNRHRRVDRGSPSRHGGRGVGAGRTAAAH